MQETEERIRAHLARGEHDEAATAILEGYGPALFGYLCSLLDEDDAKDAFAIAAEDVWRGIGGFRGDATARAWAYRVAWHAAARFSRDAYRRRRERLPSSAASRLAASAISQSALLPGSRRDRLRKLRASLAADEQTLLVLRVDRELEWEEIAAVLAGDGEEIEAAALRKRYERLKDKLERLAREQGLLD